MTWYYAPGVWPTADGIVPFRILLVAWAATALFESREQLRMVGAIGLALGTGPARDRAWHRLSRVAYPGAPA